MKHLKKYNELLKNDLIELKNEILNHQNNNTSININLIPKELLNYPFIFGNKINYVFAGVESNRDIKMINNWTFDEETAKSFSSKYNDGKIIKLKISELLKYFKYYVIIDNLIEYLYENLNDISDLDNNYISESEIIIFK